MFRVLLIGFLLATGIGCGGASAPPKRGVVETDVSSWGFRRYQAVLDPEVWIKGNPSRGHTASYVRKQAEKRGRLEDGDVINAFVIRFDSKSGIKKALIRFCRRLAQESGYVVEEERIGDTRTFLVSGYGELWAWWASGRHIIKLGGRAVRDIPEGLVDRYADSYPSTLRSGDLDAELDDIIAPKVETEEYDPDNPTPELDRAKKGRDRSKSRKQRSR